MKNYTVADFNLQLTAGAFAWPGGYPLYFVTSDGAALSFAAALDNRALIVGAIADAETYRHENSGWRVIGCDVNWNDAALYCCDTGKRIESAYAEEEAQHEKP